MLVAFAVAACAGKSSKLASEGAGATLGGGQGGTGGGSGGDGGTGGGSGGQGGTGGGSGGQAEGGAGRFGAGSGGGGAETSAGTGGEAGRGLEICGTGRAMSFKSKRALVFAVDRSVAMAESWADISQALINVVADPLMDIYSVELRLFPDPRPVSGCDAQSCSVDACAAPLVPAAELSNVPAPEDEQERALIDALMTSLPSTEVAPLGAAVEGALVEAERLRGAYDSVHVVLATAEIGNGCERDVGALVESAYVDSGTTTFVVAPASSEALPELDDLAARGGSQLSFPIGPGARGSDELVPSLVPIISGTFACDFAVPAAPAGEVPVLDATVLTVTVDDATFVAERVDDQRACGETLAWYFDRAEMPNSVVLCPELCSELHSGSSAAIEISVWCE